LKVYKSDDDELKHTRERVIVRHKYFFLSIA